MGQRDSTEPFLDILVMLPLNYLKMFLKRLKYRCGKHGIAILKAFTCSNYNLVLGKINIFDPQPTINRGVPWTHSTSLFTSSLVSTAGSLLARTTP
jgi:hypothetical protein